MNDTIGPQTEGQKLIGRKIPNCFGTRQAVVLPKTAWEFLDWLDEQGENVRQWVKSVDEKRPADRTFDDYLLERIWVLWCGRYRAGQLCPPNSPPENYDEYLKLREEQGHDATETEYVEPTLN